MITIYYQPDSKEISSWKERLNQVFLKYELVKKDTAVIPKLVDGEKQIEGSPAIEAYLNGLEQFVKGWYDDRCDRHDFDPDSTNINK